MEGLPDQIIRKNIINLIDQGILVSPDLVENTNLQTHLTSFKSEGITVLTKEIMDKFTEKLPETQIPKVSMVTQPLVTNQPKHAINLISDEADLSKKRNVQDFIGLFNSRYKTLERVLVNRRELQGVTSISRIKNKNTRDRVALIGMVTEKQITKNKNILFKFEDPTGIISVLISKNKQELLDQAKDIQLDEVIGITGSTGKNIVFANNIFLPDIPLNKELKKCPEEHYFLVLSDFHIGSNKFMAEEFDKFIKWIRCETGTDAQKKLASKIEYIFVIGDLVDGVGIYPNQEVELDIKDIYEQYKMCARYLKKIPKHIQIIVVPGNHDAMRMAEPQPPICEELAPELYKMPNIRFFGNPSFINLIPSEGFPGFNFLLYHGYSFPYYADNVESIRQHGGVDRADLIMKYLLQRRHLAPTHTSTLYIPDPKKDGLVIDKIPDFLITGHLHKTVISSYKNITTISGSCWQAKTSFMEKMGIHPEPARVPVVNLQTRDIKVLRFGK
ncbi:MAG: metallophosphoesterase [Candidatus Woesearchaeota archaeon]